MVPHMYIWFPLTLCGRGIIWSPTCTYGPPPVKCLHLFYDLCGPPTLNGTGIIWSPTCTYGPPTWNIWLMAPHTLYKIGILWFPFYLIWNRYHMVPPHEHMVPPHEHMVPPYVKCLHGLYASNGPPYLMWNRYCVIPHMYIWSPHMYCMSLMVPPYLIWNRYFLGPYLIRKGIVWSPTCTYGPP